MTLLQAERGQARSPVALKMDGMAEAAPSGPIQTDVPLPLSPNSPAGAEASQPSPAGTEEPPPVVGSPTAEAAAAIPLPSGES